MKIEAGKKYLNRLGNISGTIIASVVSNRADYDFKYHDGKWYYTKEGRFNTGIDPIDSDFDLVEEYIGPGKSETKSETILVGDVTAECPISISINPELFLRTLETYRESMGMDKLSKDWKEGFLDAFDSKMNYEDYHEGFRIGTNIANQNEKKQ